jgi:hypothetical protein
MPFVQTILDKDSVIRPKEGFEFQLGAWRCEALDAQPHAEAYRNCTRGYLSQATTVACFLFYFVFWNDEASLILP